MRVRWRSQASGDEVKVFKNGDKRGQYLGEITLLRRLKRYRTTKNKTTSEQTEREHEKQLNKTGG